MWIQKPVKTLLLAFIIYSPILQAENLSEETSERPLAIVYETSSYFLLALVANETMWSEGQSGRSSFPTDSFDLKIRKFIHGEESSGPETKTEYYAHIGSDLTLLPLLITPAYLLKVGDTQRTWIDGWKIYRAIAINNFFTTAVKLSVQRRRPKKLLIEDFPTKKDSVSSFYSGHSSNAFTAATAIVSVYPKLPNSMKAILFSLATATAILRIKADKHFFTDVAIGAVMGAATGYYTTRKDSPIFWNLMVQNKTVRVQASLRY